MEYSFSTQTAQVSRTSGVSISRDLGDNYRWNFSELTPVRAQPPMFNYDLDGPERMFRSLIKHLPLKMRLFDLVQKRLRYDLNVPMYYSLLTPLFQLVFGSNNIHVGYFADDDSDWIEAQQQLTCLLAQVCGFSERHKILEIGSGIGGPAVTVAKRFGSQVTGINITPAHIRRARRYVGMNGMDKQVHFVLGDAHHMPWIEPRFDHAYFMESISHMPDKSKVLAEVARVTGPAARVGIIDACVEDEAKFLQHPELNLFNVTWGVRTGEWARSGQIEESLKKAGFGCMLSRDLTPQILPTCGVWINFLQARKSFICEEYGADIFELIIRSVEAGADLLSSGCMSYRMWVGDKSEC